MSRFASFLLVAGREITESIKRRNFRILVGLLFLIALAAVILPEVIGGSGTPSYKVAVSSEVPTGLQPVVRALSSRVDIEVTLDIRPKGTDFDMLVSSGRYNAAISSAEPPRVIAKSNTSELLLATLRQSLATTELESRLKAAGLNPNQAAGVLNTPPPRLETVGGDQEASRGVSSVAATILYLALLTVTIQVANSTAIEKSSRVSEVLLPIVRPIELLFGKVVGVGTVSLIGLLALVLPVIGKAALGGSLPARALPSLGVGVLWFILGLSLYATLSGALGALVERPEEMGTAMQPVTIALVATFFVAQGSPDSTLGAICAYVPFTSPMVLPARFAAGYSSPIEVVVSALLLVAAIVVVVKVGSTVYKRAIVQTGKRLKFRKVLAATP